MQDCRSSIEELIETKSINKGPLFVDGGSHGGFLALHLIGQFPSDYAAAIVRNPVTAANIMDGTNDIPDWYVGQSPEDKGNEESGNKATLTGARCCWWEQRRCS